MPRAPPQLKLVVSTCCTIPNCLVVVGQDFSQVDQRLSGLAFQVVPAIYQDFAVGSNEA